VRIKLIVTGKSRQNFIKEGLDEYVKRMGKDVGFQLITLPDVKVKGSETRVKQKEGEAQLGKITDRDYVVLFDENGTTLNSMELAAFIDKHGVSSSLDICFIIGGAYGFDQIIYDRSNYAISLSKMTFSHQMVRLFVIEQLYRAFTIIKGEPYHHR